MAKLASPIVIRAASLTLTGTLAAVVGTVSTDAANATTGAVAIGDLSVMRLVCTYARNGGSVTGAPIFALDLSMDSESTAPASVGNWVPTFLLDASTFSAGVISAYPEAVGHLPSATGSTTRGSPPFDVRGANWVRVRMMDVDGAAPGAVTSLAFGGEV